MLDAVNQLKWVQMSVSKNWSHHHATILETIYLLGNPKHTKLKNSNHPIGDPTRDSFILLSPPISNVPTTPHHTKNNKFAVNFALELHDVVVNSALELHDVVVNFALELHDVVVNFALELHDVVVNSALELHDVVVNFALELHDTLIRQSHSAGTLATYIT
jgi:hypothetical protein